MILADTSVWVDHLRSGNAILSAALKGDRVVIHSFVIVELACGSLAHRSQVLGSLGKLRRVPIATDAEVLRFIESRRLMGRGIGYVDVHLLASAVLAEDTLLWTSDRRLASVARELGVHHDP